MFSKLEWLLAWRFLRSKTSEKFISVIALFSFVGIALGVATLIIVMSVMNGFRTELLNKTLGFSGHVHASAFGGELNKTDSENLVSTFNSNENVVSVSPIVEGQVLLTSTIRNNSIGGVVQGLTKEDLINKKIISQNIDSGDITKLYSPNNQYVIIGYKLARRLGLIVGDSIIMVSPKSDSTIFGSVPRKKTYKVAATFNSGMHEVDSNMVLLNIEDAQLYLSMKDKISYLEVFIKDPKQASSLAYKVLKSATSDNRLYIQGWQQRNRHLVGALKTERNVMFIILTLIILIASFNVLTTLIMLVKDKAKAISILRTIGLTRASIIRVFIIAGSIIGVVGTMLGFILGVSFALNIETIRGWVESLLDKNLFPGEIYFLSKLPAEIDNFEILLVLVIALGLSLLSTIYPAIKAARINPAEGLRNE